MNHVRCCFSGKSTVFPKGYIFLVIMGLAIPVVLQAQGGISIGETGEDPHPSAVVDIKSTDKGLLIPRMSSEERDAITEPAVGLQIVNTTTNCIQIYFPPVWQNMYCGCSNPPEANAGADQAEIAGTSTQLAANAAGSGNNGTWSILDGSGGSFVNTGNPETVFLGLSGESYTLRWTISNPCGMTQDEVLISFASSFVCGTQVEFTYRNESVTYGTVQGQGGTCWLDRNLGAGQVATAFNDEAAYGDLFQWGRLDDGHQVRSPISGTTSTLSSTDDPGHDDYIVPSEFPQDWRSPQNNDLWQGVNGVNNPCPEGFRLPTEMEFTIEMLSWSGFSSAGAFESPLKLTVAGYRANSQVYEAGSTGWYNSASTDGVLSRFLYYWGTGASMYSDVRSYGGSVRCIKN